MRKRQTGYHPFLMPAGLSIVLHGVGLAFLALAIGPQTPDSFPPIMQITLVEKPTVSPTMIPSQTEPLTPSSPVTQEVYQEAQLASPEPPPSFHLASLRNTAPSQPQGLRSAPDRIDTAFLSAPTPEAIPAIAKSVHRPRNSAHQNQFTGVLLDNRAASYLSARTPARLLHNPIPLYPRIARALGWEGRTLLRVEIREDGTTGLVKVQKSCGHPLLDETAAEAVQEWKFLPAQDGLFTVRTIVDLPIRFSLNPLS